MRIRSSQSSLDQPCRHPTTSGGENLARSLAHKSLLHRQTTVVATTPRCVKLVDVRQEDSPGDRVV